MEKHEEVDVIYFAQSWQAFLEWKRQTFPQATALSNAKHLLKEVQELIEALESGKKGEAKEETIDCLALLFGSAWLQGMDFEDLGWWMQFKLEKVKKRQWNEPDKDGVILHKKDREEVLEFIEEVKAKTEKEEIEEQADQDFQMIKAFDFLEYLDKKKMNLGFFLGLPKSTMAEVWERCQQEENDEFNRKVEERRKAGETGVDPDRILTKWHETESDKEMKTIIENSIRCEQKKGGENAKS